MARPLIVIVGQTATGKTALALQIAEAYNGEIIAADSRTVYKGMDVGTAKPTALEQGRVRHHLLDVVAPDEVFSVADFQAQARQALEDIQARGKLPIVVGGTGLYVDALIYDFKLRKVDPALRQSLEKLSVAQLQQKIIQQQLPMPSNRQNPRHLVRVLETGGQATERSGLRPHTLVLGLELPQDVLHKRIAQRVEAMNPVDLTDEIGQLAQKYGWEARALQAPGYRAFRPFIEGEATLEEAKQAFIQNDKRLAKRQATWFKRNPDIQWCQSPEQALALIRKFLNK